MTSHLTSSQNTIVSHYSKADDSSVEETIDCREQTILLISSCARQLAQVSITSNFFFISALTRIFKRFVLQSILQIDKQMANVKKFIQNIYYDPFKWSVVKSIGIFALGVKIALECKGMDLMATPSM